MKKFRFFSLAVAVVMVLFISVWAASQKVNSGKTMSVAAVSVGSNACSNEIDFYFGQPSNTATIINPGIAVGSGTVSTNAGTFQMSHLNVRCGTTTTNSTTISWNGSTPISASTTYFNGQPAKVTCYLSFCGKCIAGYQPVTGGPTVNQCNKSYNNVSMTINY